MSCPVSVSCFRRLSVTQSFSDHCSMGSLSGELGLPAITPQTAAGHSILSEISQQLSCCWLSPLLQTWDGCTLRICGAVHYWGHAISWFVSTMMFVALAPIHILQSYSCWLALLVKAAVELFMHTWTAPPVSGLDEFYMRTCGTQISGTPAHRALLLSGHKLLNLSVYKFKKIQNRFWFIFLNCWKFCNCMPVSNGRQVHMSTFAK